MSFSPTTLLKRLTALGATVSVSGDRLHVEAWSALPDDLLAGLRERKTDVLRLLHAEHAFHVPTPDQETVREVLGPSPAAADLEALGHEVAGALWELRESQAGRQPWGGPIRVRGRPLADWLPLDEVARVLRGAK